MTSDKKDDVALCSKNELSSVELNKEANIKNNNDRFSSAGLNHIYNIYSLGSSSILQLLQHLKNKNIDIKFKFSYAELVDYLLHISDILLTKNEVRACFFLLQRGKAYFTNISHAMRKPKGTVSYVLDSLISKGLIKTEPNYVTKRTLYMLHEKHPQFSRYMIYVLLYSVSEMGLKFDGI